MIATERVYRMRTSQRIVGIVLTAAGLFFFIAIWGGVLFYRREPKFLEMMLPVIFLTLAVFTTIPAFCNSVLLSDQRIELRSFSGTNTLPLDKIRGRRRYLGKGHGKSPSIWHLVIESNDDRFPKIDIEELYKFDDEFTRGSLPCLIWMNSTRLDRKRRILGLHSSCQPSAAGME